MNTMKGRQQYDHSHIVLDYSSSSIYLPFFQPEKFDTAWVRRFALSFERKITKNAELRAKFENDPQKYVAGPDCEVSPG